MTNAARKMQEDLPGLGDNASSVLQDSVQRLLAAMAERAVSSVADRVSSTSDRLNDYAEGGGGGLLAALTGAEQSDEGGSPLKSALGDRWEDAKQLVKGKASDVKEAVTGGGDSGGGDGGGQGSGKGKKLKLTNIVETIDVGVPVQLAYNQWTQFADFPSFMKKVERVEQEADEKLEWKAQVFLSHRTWESTIIEQVPDERIVWRSKGAKGFVDGAVTFHEVTPDLTRIIVILEYHPKGFFEKTGNLWRAPGRRARLELKHFQRHIMTQSVLHPEEVVGWRGEIRRRGRRDRRARGQRRRVRGRNGRVRGARGLRRGVRSRVGRGRAGARRSRVRRVRGGRGARGRGARGRGRATGSAPRSPT